MFRIDNDTVCDATMAGGPARYINHSCDPNCVAEVVEIDKEGKIIIITNRRISKGEEVNLINKWTFMLVNEIYNYMYNNEILSGDSEPSLSLLTVYCKRFYAVFDRCFIFKS